MQNSNKKAWGVLIAAIAFNLSVGSLYTWSIIRSVLMNEWGWTSTQAGLPFTIAVVFFAIGLLVGGRIQDAIGPRWVVTFGGFLVGLGMIVSGLVGNSPTGIMIGFGVLSGAGIGFGYGCVTPPALKWFHPSKKGMVSGLSVGGFGFGAVFYGPITQWVLDAQGIENTFLFFGIGIMVLSMIFAQFIKNPPADYVPAEPKTVKTKTTKKVEAKDYFWREMVKTPRFYMMFVLFLIISSVGLMIIGSVTRIATLQMGITDAAVLAGLVSFMAICNTVGRILGGLVSDKIGQINTIFVIIVVQLANMIGFVFYNNFPTLIIGIIATGMCFGALLAVFPALTAGQFGLKNYGANYGVVYLAWGLSGVVAPLMADYFYDTTGAKTTAFIISAAMMVLMFILNMALKRNVSKVEQEEQTANQEVQTA